MSSPVELCNRALTRLGDATITAMDEDTPRARACNAIFAQVRDSVLSEHRWNGTTRRAVLVQESDAPAFGPTYAYALPTEPYCLRVWEMLEEADDGYGWAVEGRTLTTDSATASIVYTARVEDMATLPPLVHDAIVERLVQELAYTITGQAGVSESMTERADVLVKRKKGLDGAEGSPRTVTTRSLLDVRQS